MSVALTREYGRFAAVMSAGHAVPAQAIDVVRLGFTDCCGVILAGSNEDVVKRLRSFLAHQGGAATSRVMFGGERLSMTQAGLINSTAAHAHDYDDWAFSNHPSAVLVPTILAAAEAAPGKVDGKRLVAAYVGGYEAWADLMSREPDHMYAKGWHPTAVFGPVGAAVAASIVLGLDEQRAMHAVAIACSLAGGVFENFGTMAKPLHGGRAAEAGLTAAAMAAEGIEASPTAVEGKHGLLTGVSPKGRTDRDRPVRLGEHWQIVKEGLNIKKYPTVGASQRTIDAVLHVMRDWPIEPDKIRRVVSRISVKHLEVMPFRAAQTGLQAKFSLPFAVACAVLHRTVGLDQLADDVVQAPAMQNLMSKVEPETTTESLPEWPSAAPFDVVHFHMDDGSVVSTPEVRRATGHGDTPLALAEIRAKFDLCARFGHIPESRAGALFAAMQRIDRVTGVDEIPSV